MRIREARAEDAAAICAITNDLIRDTLITFTTLERTIEGVSAEIAARGARHLVAEDDGQVLGHAYYGAFRPGPGYARTAELTIHLDPAARGCGLGRALMEALTERAVAAGIHVLVAGVSSANPGAIAFHAALGFAEVGRMPEVGRKAGQWLDLVLMQKILPAAAQHPPDRTVAKE